MRIRFGIVLALVLGSSATSAQAPSAAELLEKGVALRKAGDEAGALEVFKRSYELDPSPRALGQMGLAAKSLRLWVEAARYLQGALATADPWVEKNRPALQQALELVANNVASLRVETNAPHAKLSVNGRELAELPMSEALPVVAGATELEVRASGFKPAYRREALPARRVTALRIELEPEAPPEPPRPAVEPRAPAAPLPPPPKRDAERSLPESPERTWAWVAGGVGLVGVGVGTYFGLRTLSLKRERDEVCPDVECDTARGVELDESARSSALASTLGFGVGALGLGTAAVLFLTAPTSRTDVSATLGPRRAAASLRLRF